MIPAWTDEDLRCLARDHRNDPDVLDLIAGVRRVLALHAPYNFGDGLATVCAECGDERPVSHPCPTVSALNDPPNGA